MTYDLFRGDGVPSADGWHRLPDLPPWRRRPRGNRTAPPFVISEELRRAVNAALQLRRPLLLTGPPGSGKSTLVELIAAELGLGEVLRWHVTSKSTLGEALFSYDALGRLHTTQISDEAAVELFVRLGPLGTALASPDRPRALLIDEIDKSDIDLPSDLLNVLETGTFEIPPLARAAEWNEVFAVRGADGLSYPVPLGRIETQHFPVIVLTSNGERSFPGPFLRRCVRFEMPTPTAETLARIVRAHLQDTPPEAQDAITSFAQRLAAGEQLALNQLIETVHLITVHRPSEASSMALRELLMRELTE